MRVVVGLTGCRDRRCGRSIGEGVLVVRQGVTGFKTGEDAGDLGKAEDGLVEGCGEHAADVGVGY